MNDVIFLVETCSATFGAEKIHLAIILRDGAATEPNRQNCAANCFRHNLPAMNPRISQNAVKPCICDCRAMPVTRGMFGFTVTQMWCKGRALEDGWMDGDGCMDGWIDILHTHNLYNNINICRHPWYSMMIYVVCVLIWIYCNRNLSYTLPTVFGKLKLDSDYLTLRAPWFNMWHAEIYPLVN